MLATLLLFACDRDQAPELPPTTPAEEAPAELVSSHTSGRISRRDALVVRFVDPVPAGVTISVSPETAGTLATTDRELTFTPSADWTPGAEYVATVDLAAMAAPPYSFDFAILEQAYRVELDGLEASASDGSTQRLTGSVKTADVAGIANVEAMLTATYGDQPVKAAWTHSDDLRSHRFVVDDLARAETTPTTLALAFAGEPIGVDTDRDEAVRVPPLSSFALSSARAVNHPERVVELRFSDPVDGAQDLAGLIRIGDHDDLRFVVDGSIVRVYADDWAGQELVEVSGLTSRNGATLTEQAPVEVSFERLKPQVRFAGSGVIYPATQGLSVPIEVANLDALRVRALRVHDANVPQFLQVNDLGGDYELSRVGRVVWEDRVEIDLGEDGRDRWVRLGLDVEDLVAEHPAGLYHLELAFTSNDIAWDCAEQPDEEPPALEEGEADWEGGSADASYWDGAYGWVEGGWDNRHDPCHAGYYQDYWDHDIRTTRNVLVSNLGLTAKRGEDGELTVVATDLRSADPVEGAAVRVLDFQLDTLAAATTDADGFATLDPARKPFVVMARDGDHAAYLRLDRGSSLAVSHFDVSGQAVTSGLKGFLYGERGVWRPGDDIHMSFVLLDTTGDLPDDHPVVFELEGARGERLERRVVKGSPGGFYRFTTSTAPDAPTGTYVVRAHVGGTTFTESLRVDTVMPNRLKIDLDADEDALLADEPRLKAELSSRWLHGALADKLETAVEVSLRPKATTFDSYPDHSFDLATIDFATEPEELFRGRLDEAGVVSIDEAIEVGGEAPGLLTASFRTRVFEPSGAFSVEEQHLTVSPHERYLGLKTPKGDVARGMLLTDTPHTVDIVAVDAHGKPAGDGEVELVLYEVDWRWWWEQGEEQLADYAGSDEHRPVAEGIVQLKDGHATWDFEVKYPEWGRYVLLAKDVDGTHRASKVLYIDWPGWAGRAQGENPGGAAVLSVTADKEEVQVGEEVSLSIPTSLGGRALVSLETGTEVLGADWVDPTGDTTRYTFTATAEMAPSVYAHVTLLQPHLDGTNDLPIRMYGVVPLEVVDPATKLEPQLAVADHFEPESTASITVSEGSGKAMSYTLAVVDEGLLGLTRYQTPDPWGAFYRREMLGVRTWDVFDLVAGAFGGALEGMLAIGGDAPPEEPPAANANRFPPVVEVLGPFQLAAGEEKTHDIEVPRYVGEVRVMLVAGDGQAFGSAEQSVPVKKPVIVLATLPRVLSLDELVSLPVSVFALDEGVGEAEVSVEVEGPVSLVGGDSRELRFDGVGDRMVDFELKAGSEPGVAKVHVVATGGGDRSVQTIEIDVRHPGVRATEVLAAEVLPGQSWNVDVAAVGAAPEALLEVSTVPPLDLGRRLDELVRYPHGCVEQTTSGAFPQVYLSQLLELSDSDEAKTRDYVNAGLSRLRSFQLRNGGFGSWPGSASVDDWSSSYAGHFLLEAERAGYRLPSGMRDSWVGYQRDRAASWTPEGNPLAQAYRLYTLALAGSPDTAAMNRLRESTDDLTARWRLATAYHLAGQKEAARKLVDGLGTDVPTYAEQGGTYGTDVRDEAMILEALVTMGADPERQLELAKRLSAALGEQSFLSTQTTAYALVALARFSAQSEAGPAFRWRWGKENGEVRSETPLAWQELDFTAETQALGITNGGDSALFVRLVTSGLPAMGEERPSSNGLSLSVSHVDHEGRPVDVSDLDHGTDFVAVVEVANTGKHEAEQLALTVPVASGWEISGVASGPGTDWDYRDVRDDRVHTYFSLDAGEKRSFELGLNAAYRGRTYLPPARIEAMYDATVHAQVPGQWLTVRRPGTQL